MTKQQQARIAQLCVGDILTWDEVPFQSESKIVELVRVKPFEATESPELWVDPMMRPSFFETIRLERTPEGWQRIA